MFTNFYIGSFEKSDFCTVIAGISGGEKEGQIMKTIQVVAAIIRKGNKILATQRGYGAFKDGWEFPGGKIEPGETPKTALLREIEEELAVRVAVGEPVAHIEYDYPEFHLSMDCFWAEIISGEPVLKEHQAAKWLSGEELDSVAWLPADLDLIEQLKKDPRLLS